MYDVSQCATNHMTSQAQYQNETESMGVFQKQFTVHTSQVFSVHLFREKGVSLIVLSSAWTKIVSFKQFGTVRLQAGAYLSAKERSLLWEQ